MRMPCSANGVRGWLAGFGSRPVVLSSPHTVSECLDRLAGVTAQRGQVSWYLDPKTAGCPGPRFRGEAGPQRIWVARFADVAGRDSFAPWLNARLEPAAGGGTELRRVMSVEVAARWVRA
jgi:hypothetical protein